MFGHTLHMCACFMTYTSWSMRDGSYIVPEPCDASTLAKLVSVASVRRQTNGD